MKNPIIRIAMIKNNVRGCQVARDILKVSDSTYFRMMRKDLPDKEQLRIAAMIEDYAAKGGRIHE